MIVFTTKIDFDPIKQQNWVLLGSPQGRPYRCLLGSYLACRVHHKQLRSVYLYMYISAHLLEKKNSHTEQNCIHMQICQLCLYNEVPHSVLPDFKQQD